MPARTQRGTRVGSTPTTDRLPRMVGDVEGEYPERLVRQNFVQFLKANLYGRNREAALVCLKKASGLLDLHAVGATHLHYWSQQKLEGSRGSQFRQYAALQKLFGDLETACDALTGSAKAFINSPAAQQWVRPVPMAGSPVYTPQLWDHGIPELWAAANADDLLGPTSLGINPKGDAPPLVSRLESFARLFRALTTASKNLGGKGRKHIFEGEGEAIIRLLHVNCLRALHAHRADLRCFRSIAHTVHWFVAGVEPGPAWGKRAATRARTQFRSELEPTSLE